MPDLAIGRFRVGAQWAGVGGGGTLTVSPGALILEPDKTTWGFSLGTAARVVHTDPDLVVITACLTPPWFNTSVRIHDDHASAQVFTWLGVRRRLTASLRSCGFNVHQVTTWISRDVGPTRVPPAQPG